MGMVSQPLRTVSHPLPQPMQMVSMMTTTLNYLHLAVMKMCRPCRQSTPPKVVRVSSKGNRGVPATRYDEIFEVAANFMNPPTISAAMEGDDGEEWIAAMEAEIRSLWENEVLEEVASREEGDGNEVGTSCQDRC